MLNKNQKSKIITEISTNQNGYSYIIPMAIFVVMFIGGTAVLVLNAKHKKTAQSVVATSATTAKPKAALNSQNKSTLPTSSTVPSPTSSPTSTASSTSSKPKSSSTTSSQAPAANQPVTSTAQSQPALSALTTVISNLAKGIATQVTVNNITIPGPISNATGRPIVFSVNGQTYFAYRQGQRPDFGTTAAQTASTMAVIPANQTASVEAAYLDKGNILVNPNQQAVGYSTGGN